MLTLVKIKLNLRIDSGDASEDLYLNSLIEPAFELFQSDCNRVVYKTQAEFDAVSSENRTETAVVMNSSMERALIMLISHWFNNRESHTDIKLSETPMGYQHIVNKYRVDPC